MLHYALALAPETDFFIHKAIGWALHDHARTQPEAVRAFIALGTENLDDKFPISKGTADAAQPLVP